MLSQRFALAVFAYFAAVLVPSVFAQDNDDPPNYSIFVNADGAIGFGFSVLEENEDQFYFTLRVHRTHAWGAIGLGSDDMPGALHLLVYDNADQSNVTFSPRISYGYYEPAYYPEFDFVLLEGTGIHDEHMVVKGLCLKDCFTWPAKGTDGGRIDVNSTEEVGIYALGPLEGFASDKVDESLKFHAQYGTFIMDMKRAHGATEPPPMDDDTRSTGAKLDQRFVRKADVVSTVHAVIMVLAIVLLMPLGAVMLRLGGWVKWHALNQTVSMLLVLAGFGVGIATSLRYQRSRGFNSYHQVIGYFIVSFVLIQFALGILHHRQYRHTQERTKFGKIHLWMGRAILLLGILNGFFGFTFALNRRYGIILAALVIAVCLSILFVILGKRFLTRQRLRTERLRSGQGSPYDRPSVRPSGNQQQRPQWQGSGGHPEQGFTGNEPPPGYSPPQHNIGLREVVHAFRRSEPQSQRRPTRQSQAWGNPQAAQAPRELV